MDPNICFPRSSNHWKHWWKMKSIKTGKEDITDTNWLTTWFSKFPGMVFKESRHFFYFAGVQFCWNCSEFASVERQFSFHKHQGCLVIWECITKRRKTFSNWKWKYPISHHTCTWEMWTKLSIHWAAQFFTKEKGNEKISPMTTYLILFFLG